MRLRNLLTATAVSALTGALAVGALSTPAHAVTAPSSAKAGDVVAWGNEASAGSAIAVPDALGPVSSVAVNPTATAVTTVDGDLRIWGSGPAYDEAPTEITDATAVTIGAANGALLHADGQITSWGGSAAFGDVPSDLRAKAIAIQINTGYVVRPDGTLATWGEAPTYPTPESGLTDLVDVSASGTHILALHADGTVSIWGNTFLPGVLDVPDFGGKKVVQIVAGPAYSTVVLEDGTIKTWGFEFAIPAGEPDFDGQTPAEKVVNLSLGQDTPNAAAVTADGVVHAWGSTTEVTAVPESLTGQPVSAVAVSNNHAAAIVTTFRDVTKPTVAGAPTVGQTLTATPATFSLTPDAPATGQWYAGADPIAGRTATTLVLEAAQLGKQISYRSTAIRGEDTVTSASTPTAAVAPATVASTTTLAVSPAKGAVGAARTVTATVAKTGGTPTGTVTFTTGTTTGTGTLAAGKATWTLPTNLKVGSHQVTASYAGDTTTNPSTSAALTVTVAKATAKVTAKAKAKGKTKKVAKKVTITVTVKAPQGVSAAGKVTITLKGKTKVKPITVKVNAKGVATATVKNLKHGKYTATLKYAGNTSINKATGKASFKA